jgi:hypothetical protein
MQNTALVPWWENLKMEQAKKKKKKKKKIIRYRAICVSVDFLPGIISLRICLLSLFLFFLAGKIREKTPT